MEVSVGFITLPSRRHLSHTHLSRATCEQPKSQETATYLAPVQQSIRHTTSSDMPSSSSQSSWSLHRNPRKHLPGREAPQILPFQIGCRLPKQHFLQQAGAQNQETDYPPQRQLHPGSFGREAVNSSGF